MEKSDLYRYVAYNIFSTDSLPLGRWTEPFFPTKQENTDYNILYKAESEIKRNDKVAFVKCLQNWKQEVEKNRSEIDSNPYTIKRASIAITVKTGDR